MAVILGLVLIALAVVAGAVGYQTQYPGAFNIYLLVQELYPSVTGAALATGVTVIILGGIYEGRLRRRERISLIRQMRSRDNVLALEAVEALRERGSLFSGALDGIKLTEANLQRAYLWGASLQGTNLGRANLAGAVLNAANLRRAYLERTLLKGAALRQADLRGAFLGDADLGGADLRQARLDGSVSLTGAQLAYVARMRGATVPDGTRYDGRFRLPGDLLDAQAQGIRENDVEAMAHWYNVDPVAYSNGQVWANENLGELRTIVTQPGVTLEPETELDDDDDPYATGKFAVSGRGSDTPSTNPMD